MTQHAETQDIAVSVEEFSKQITLIEQAEMAEAEYLNENVKFKTKKEVVLKRLITRRAIIMAKAHNDIMYDRYIQTFKKLIEIRSIIMKKYGNMAKSQAVKSSGISANVNINPATTSKMG